MQEEIREDNLLLAIAKYYLWPLFLSTVFVFKSNKETEQLLSVFGIYMEELEEFIKHKTGQEEVGE